MANNLLHTQIFGINYAAGLLHRVLFFQIFTFLFPCCRLASFFNGDILNLVLINIYVTSVGTYCNLFVAILFLNEKQPEMFFYLFLDSELAAPEVFYAFRLIRVEPATKYLHIL